MRVQTAIPTLPRLRPTVRQASYAETPRGEFSRSILDDGAYVTDFDVTRNLFTTEKNNLSDISKAKGQKITKPVKVKVENKTPRKLNAKKEDSNIRESQYNKTPDPKGTSMKPNLVKVKNKKGKISSLASHPTFETQPDHSRVGTQAINSKKDSSKVPLPEQRKEQFNENQLEDDNEEESSGENEENQQTQEEYDDLEFAPELKQLHDLAGRIPDPSTINTENVFEITPILDRILCTVSEMSINVISTFTDHYVFRDLQNHLFALIDVDDFLLRTIICRILLTFAIDSTSPLLSPICKIFFKLSIDESNDFYFVEEKLAPLLLRLIEISSPESKVYAAGALKNITKSEEVRQDLISEIDENSSNIISLVFSFFDPKINQTPKSSQKGKSTNTQSTKIEKTKGSPQKSKNSTPLNKTGKIINPVNAANSVNFNPKNEHSIPLKIQLLGIIRHMSEELEFCQILCEKSFLSLVYKDINEESFYSNRNEQKLIQETFRIIPTFSSMKNEEKLFILKKLYKFQNSLKGKDNDFRADMISILPGLCNGIEDSVDCVKIILLLIKIEINEPNELISLMEIAIKCADFENGKKILSSDNPNIFLQILDSESETSVCAPVYQLIKKFDQPSFKQAVVQYSMYDF